MFDSRVEELMAEGAAKAGVTLTDRLAVVELIGATTTNAGLKLERTLDTRPLSKGQPNVTAPHFDSTAANGSIRHDADKFPPS
jgi:hypothetical protein